MATTTIRRLQTRLDSLALEQLRQVAAQQQARIEALEGHLAFAEESAEFWREYAHELQEAALEGDGCTHRVAGMTKGGQMMVVRVDDEPRLQA